MQSARRASEGPWLTCVAFGDVVLGDTFRHRFATRAYRGTRNLRAVQVLLGHSSIATTERYVAVDDSEIRAAMVAAL
jgi:site-specific recombinase XerD